MGCEGQEGGGGRADGRRMDGATLHASVQDGLASSASSLPSAMRASTWQVGGSVRQAARAAPLGVRAVAEGVAASHLHARRRPAGLPGRGRTAARPLTAACRAAPGGMLPPKVEVWQAAASRVVLRGNAIINVARAVAARSMGCLDKLQARLTGGPPPPPRARARARGQCPTPAGGSHHAAPLGALLRRVHEGALPAGRAPRHNGRARGCHDGARSLRGGPGSGRTAR